MSQTMGPTEPVYFVHISDSHIGPEPGYSRHGHVALPCSVRAVALINALPQKPDFVVHTGDIVTEPDAASYRLAAETFDRLEAPVYYVTGNHDRARDIRHYFRLGPHQALSDDPDTLSYAFEVRGYRFLVLDARGPDEIDPHGLLSAGQLALLEAECRPDGPPLTIFVHYPALPLNSLWMDAYMLIINGEAMHQRLLPARGRLRGVFHGHVHQPMQTSRDGITYFGVASLFSQFSAWPGSVTTGLDADHPPGFAFVHLLPGQTIVHQHIFPRPK